MTEIDFAYFNYEHGALIDGRDHFYRSGRGYRFGGLVRVAGDGGRWPHILVTHEGCARALTRQSPTRHLTQCHLAVVAE